MLKKFMLVTASVISIAACTNNSPPPVSESEALARLEALDRLDAKEYPKYRQREEEAYQTAKRRRLDDLEAERIHYQNQAIKYQNSRQQTRDMIDDIGRIQMNEAKAINKAYENRSKKQDVYIIH
ncbi:hypothetical protein BKK49_04985 [Rodentibacter rarus]|uniref:Uncharacterized protein n=1 Tax=Rodentibacter rarus TaxID=1908260 RepID=A0A1V3IK81_9PAST|nr:hypothetical protein [Rodentibacter rarus]OOF41369.1 hypothetical protein BKK50_08585 [Rodentibacter rarus]OOF41398.1 hypothetical protein BKK49_04985 [Rodentibacter rarus]